MHAVISQQRQPAHEAQQGGPPCVKPGPLPEDDVRRDALSELAELTKESHLNSQHVLSSGPKAGEQAGAQASPIQALETVGLTTVSNRRLNIERALMRMSALSLALKWAAAPLPFCASFATGSSNH